MSSDNMGAASGPPPHSLSPDSGRTLQELEAVIEDGRAEYVAVAHALLELSASDFATMAQRLGMSTDRLVEFIKPARWMAP